MSVCVDVGVDVDIDYKLYRDCMCRCWRGRGYRWELDAVVVLVKACFLGSAVVVLIKLFCRCSDILVEAALLLQ